VQRHLQGRRALKVVWDEAQSGHLDSDALLAQYKTQAATAGKAFARPAKDAPAAPPAAKTVEAV
jgi:hypothetical protein